LTPASRGLPVRPARGAAATRSGRDTTLAKPTAPLLSFGATGQIAKAAVYSSWRGRSYVRRHVIPANPNTAAQQLSRGVFSWLNAVWKLAPNDFIAPWTAYAKGKVLTNRNAFQKFNNATLQANADLSVFAFSPGALGGFSPTNVVVTPGVGTLTITADAATNYPADWTPGTMYAAVIKSQDPTTAILYDITTGSDASSPYSIAITGLDAVEYQVGVWQAWTRADGSTAYSPSVQTTGTPT